MAKRSKHRLKGKIVKIAKGVAIYQTHASPFYFARILDLRTGRYTVRSTKETSRLEARKVADELAYEMRSPDRKAEPEFSFKYYAQRYVEIARGKVQRSELNKNYVRTTTVMLDNDDWGLIRHLGTRDVRELKTRDWQIFIEKLLAKRPDLSSSTRNSLKAAFRNVMKVVRDDGLIDVVPATPRVTVRDNPRPFFRFHPLVSKEKDEYDKLKAGAKKLAAKKLVVRGVLVTEELYDLILFTVHSFVRPITTELYALRHSDINVQGDKDRDEKKWLQVTVRNGKTGMRIASTMPGAVAPYKRICDRYPEAKGEDYVFLPDYPNRQTAARIIARQFNAVLQEEDLKSDPILKTERTIYSLRHTAICMRLVLSKGQVNIYTLAKNAGTSVNQIERFYARNLPMAPELVKNLQIFGD
ncbi:MAG: integrase [Proteobacteria bacterium]|nr:integrase [Pseudomonadota bacterium]